MKTRILIDIQEGNVVRAMSTSDEVEITVIGYDFDDEEHQIPRLHAVIGIFDKGAPEAIPLETCTPQIFDDVVKRYKEKEVSGEHDASIARQDMLWFSNREQRQHPSHE